MAKTQGRKTEAEGPVEHGWRVDPIGKEPTALPDLQRRLELLSKFGVRSYRDGMLSIDLDPTAISRGKKQQPAEQPYIPPP